MVMNRITTTTARRPTQRAFDDCRTTCAARSGDSSTERVEGGDVKRSTGAGSTAGRGTGSRCSGSSSEPLSGVSVIGPGPSDAPGRGARRDEPGLTERAGEGPEGDLARVDGQHAGRVDRDREPVHATRRRSERRAVRLDPEPVIPRPVTGAFEPEVLETRVGLAAEVRTALVERADVERLAVAGGVLARKEALLARAVQDHEGAGLGVIGREALLDGEGAVLELDRVEVADGDRGAEAAGQVRPREGQRPGGHFEQPQAHACPEGHPHQLAA